MKTNRLSKLVWMSALVLSGLCLAGCSTMNSMMGFHKSPKNDAAANSLERAAGEAQAESRAVEVVMITLNDLVNRPAADLKPQFNRFEAALDRMIESAKRNENAADRVARRNAEYFKAWDRDLESINYELVRNQSEARKQEVARQFNDVHGRYRETQSVIPPLISYLEDIRTVLRADLTLAGLESVKGIAQNANRNGRIVQDALLRTADELATAGAQMSSLALSSERSATGASDQPATESQRAEAPGAAEISPPVSP